MTLHTATTTADHSLSKAATKPQCKNIPNFNEYLSHIFSLYSEEALKEIDFRH